MPITQDLIDRNRRELLELSTRNRQLPIPVVSKIARLIRIDDEFTPEVSEFGPSHHHQVRLATPPSCYPACDGSK
jgi:hypothetical protein